ncbi:pyridoxamine 5'-phosphate oxidase [Roseococcus sp. SDR]|uniref:pyridoxamine 5'-phosphate oxidase n=1 Tax=Roseococcus sp. SDR TaxID=2835532 RepID=UPI001BCD127E|nr:pyridoxamine 5'-phosphate oxidase [Roseococcus sp. SDR]MBS7788502.1 pyridoxamine 5'-phosphate oxidase [Roseococcus sp. SDR]MBV1843816.1 pyridoxamine 5'-phosphate oxidase [Roseococcus sp. SDR]
MNEDPYALFAEWMAEAARSEPNDPNAMCLATATPEGRPSARMVLLKGHDARGFVFYTNLESRKGGELAANPFAALCFHWKTLTRSVRVEGRIEAVTAEEADAYYASRSRGSRIGAWASRQSRPLEGRWALEKAVAEYTMKFGVSEIPRPPFWSGFRLLPERIEFWRDMPFRLHERRVFVAAEAGWRTEALYP